MPLFKAANQFVWQGVQREACDHPQFFRSKLPLHTFPNIGHKPVPERNHLFGLPVGSRPFRLPLKLLLFLLVTLAEVDFACLAYG